ncbi:MAG: NAD+ synthetase [Myxococcota bacterium]
MTLSELLAQLRADRGFDVAHALAGKIDRINTYFSDCGLDAAVIGVSGGIDSAVALALLCAARDAPGSPLRRVVGVLAPIGGRGATGQAQALHRGEAAIEAAGAEAWRCDLTAAQAGYVAAFAEHAESTAWAEGQLLSVVRTPAFYYAAALLQAAGHRSLVVGTTNRDEGAWLGFFGKASDGMVDLQPISDLHKSEVIALAQHLGVPAEIIDATPRGDVYDGRVDEEMIGAPYWFVELFLLLRCQGGEPALNTTDRGLYDRYAAALCELHRHNAHKYRVGSPAIHLDVYPRSVPGGW